MKILFVDTYYPTFLAEHYASVGARGSYAEQRQRLFEQRFGVSDYYSRHLRPLGVEAEELIVNAVPLQLRWARERGMPLGRLGALLPSSLLGSATAGKLADRSGALGPILVEQIRHARPDVLYLHDLNVLPPDVLREVKQSVRLVVGQIACPLPNRSWLEPFDLILTSFPHYVPRLEAGGLRSAYFRLGFEASLIEEIGAPVRSFAATFVGGISSAHGRGTEFLTTMAETGAVDFFGYGADALPPRSPIRARHHGPVWGRDMYRTLASSRVTLNRHVDVAEDYANNMRLYEATGMGALLVTDAKSNLADLFEPGREVVAYRSNDEAAELIRYYADHPDERDEIARAGRARTLREHTYEARMKELAYLLRTQLTTRVAR